MGIEVHRIICNPSARPHKRVRPKEASSSRRPRQATARVVFARSGKRQPCHAAMHFSWCTIGNIREVEEGGIFSAGKRPPLRKISAEATAVIHTAIIEPSVPPTPKTSLHVYISFWKKTTKNSVALFYTVNLFFTCRQAVTPSSRAAFFHAFFIFLRDEKSKENEPQLAGEMFLYSRRSRRSAAHAARPSFSSTSSRLLGVFFLQSLLFITAQ